MNKIANWVKLLLKAIVSKPIEDINSKAAAVRWAGKNKQLKAYISKGFKKSFLKEKESVMLGYDDGDLYDGRDEDNW